VFVSVVALVTLALMVVTAAAAALAQTETIVVKDVTETLSNEDPCTEEK
jgi:hypothetical protein